MHEHRATILRHIDGDTSHVLIHLGEHDFGFDFIVSPTTKRRVRWEGINAPEMGTTEGREALAALADILPVGTTCTIRSSHDRDRYGRHIATFILDDGTNVNDWMVEKGYAKPFMLTKEANA